MLPKHKANALYSCQMIGESLVYVESRLVKVSQYNILHGYHTIWGSLYLLVYVVGNGTVRVNLIRCETANLQVLRAFGLCAYLMNFDPHRQKLANNV